MTVYLVRHAVAEGRSEWNGPDRARPLTKRGERQARGLVDLLGKTGIRHVHSSAAVRCRDTVQPLADELGLKVHDEETLAEGAKTKEALDLVRTLAAKKGDTVVCAHGDLIPEIVRRLTRDGTRWDGELRFAKGSTWVLDWDGHQFTQARYEAPSEG